TQRRSRSTQPEFQYNLDLARHYLNTLGVTFEDTLTQPVLAHPEAVVAERRQALAEQHDIDPAGRWIFVHPGHGGSANNLSIAQYAALVNALGLGEDHAVLVTAGPGEEADAVALYNAIDVAHKCLHKSTGGLREFTEVLATADLFISGSTGPAHLAGALNRRTAVFYPRRATSSPLRWQTLNAAEQRITFTPPVHKNERDMASIDPVETAAAIREAFPALELG
ncbi:MAG: glycosyltransferase family 9 protein, partial [Pseudomonadota bacterium]